jgi:type II secretory pathway component PulF
MSTTPPPVDRERSSGLAIVGTVLHGAMVLGLFVLYIASVPRAKKTFDEFGLTLPKVTQYIIRLSNWLAEYWWVLVPFLLLAGVANFLLIRSLGQRSRLLPVLWVVFVALMLSAIGTMTLVALEIPMVKLREGLAK